MNLLLSLLIILLIVLTSGTHLYFVWKGKHNKILYVQISIIILAILLGVWTIYHITTPSIATLFNEISPFGK